MENKDLRLMIGDVKFSTRAAGVLKNGNKILFQRKKGDEFWALPGGAVEVLERGRDVLKRELKEEIGLTDVNVIRPLWFVEYFFNFNKVDQHQYIIGYLLETNDEEIKNKEEFDGIEEGKDIVYRWFDIDTLKDAKIKPDYLKEKLINKKEEFEFIEEEDM